MSTARFALTHVSDTELLTSLHALVRHSNAVTADMLAHIAEVDARGLYREHAFSNMFSYCTEALHLSEPAAAKRLHAARAARRYPEIFELVAQGDLRLSAVTLLAPHLTDDNHDELLVAAKGKSKRAVEELVAARFPAPDAAALLRRLPERTTPAALSLTFAASASPCVPPPVKPALATAMALATQTPASRPHEPPSPPAVLSPLSPERYRLQLTLGAETRAKLLRAQALLRHQLPAGDMAAVVDRALEVLIDELERRKYAKRKQRRTGTQVTQQSSAATASPLRPAPSRSRHIPNQVKRQVAERDGFRCTFVGEDGRRCGETGKLEFHHDEPFARGGASDVAGVRLMCRAHNALLAERDFGLELMQRCRERGSGVQPPGNPDDARPGRARHRAEQAPAHSLR